MLQLNGKVIGTIHCTDFRVNPTRTCQHHYEMGEVICSKKKSHMITSVNMPHPPGVQESVRNFITICAVIVESVTK